MLMLRSLTLPVHRCTFHAPLFHGHAEQLAKKYPYDYDSFVVPIPAPVNT